MDEKYASKTSIVENKEKHRNFSIKINESVKLNPITVYSAADPGLERMKRKRKET